MKTRLTRNLLSLVSRLTFILFISLALHGASHVLAQDNTPKRGFQPANSFTLSDVETINTTNGNLILNFPIGSLPSGRGGMSATMRLLYNSKLYQ